MLKLRFSNIRTSRSGEITLGQRSLDQSVWWIGRDEDCDLMLDDERVSRKHAKIVLGEEALYIQDAQSRNGVFVNGERLTENTPQKLSVDDYVLVGETSLLVEDIAEFLPAVQQQPQAPQAIPFWEGGDITVRCFRIVQETSDTKTFWFCGESPILFQYYPGQFITLELEIEGKKVRRPYSISSSPSNPYAISVTVKRVPGGSVSNWLNDHFKVEDRASFVGSPLGEFTCLPTLPQKMLFIAAGSGITPLMSMMRWIYNTSSRTHIVLLYSVRNPREVIFYKDILKMAEEMTEEMPATLRPYITVTRPEMARDWAGLTGRISRSMVELLVPDLHERSVYCCGPSDFTASIRSILTELNLPKSQYKEEAFGQSSRPPATATTGTATAVVAEEIPAVVSPPSSPPSRTVEATPISVARPIEVAQANPIAERNGRVAAPAAPTVVFAKSNKQTTVDPETTILEAAQDEGVNIPYSCKAGVCGACRVKLKSGDVAYQQDPSYLSPQDRQAGVVLTCIAKPVGKVEIEA